MARKKNIVIRVNENELAKIKEMAKKAGYSVSEFIRTLIIYGEVK